MKRKSIITVLALVLVLALSLSIFSACNKKHKYSSEWKFDEKTHWHECTTKKHTDTTEKLPHEFKEEIVKAADYGVVGEKKFTCKDCGYSYTEDIDALGAKDNEIKLQDGKTLDKTYDGSAVDVSDKFSFNGNGEVTLMFKAQGAEDDAYDATAPKDAGEYTVKVSVRATAEWKSATKTFDFAIAKKELTATGTKEYDGNATMPATLTGVIAGDAVTATITMDSKNVGATVQSVVLDGADKDNYTINIANVSVTVTQREIKIKDLEVEYNGMSKYILVNIQASSEDATKYNFVTGDHVNLSLTFNGKANAGDTQAQLKSISLNSNDAENYKKPEISDVTVTVLQRSITVMNREFKKTKVGVGQFEGSTWFALTEEEGFVAGETELKIGIKDTAVASYAVGGPYNMEFVEDRFVLSGDGKGNYKVVGAVGCTLTISGKEVTLNATYVDASDNPISGIEGNFSVTIDDKGISSQTAQGDLAEYLMKGENKNKNVEVTMEVIDGSVTIAAFSRVGVNTQSDLRYVCNYGSFEVSGDQPTFIEFALFNYNTQYIDENGTWIYTDTTTLNVRIKIRFYDIATLDKNTSAIDAIGANYTAVFETTVDSGEYGSVCTLDLEWTSEKITGSEVIVYNALTGSEINFNKVNEKQYTFDAIAGNTKFYVYVEGVGGDNQVTLKVTLTCALNEGTPTRLEFSAGANELSSGELTYAAGEEKRFVVSVGSIMNGMKYTISNIPAGATVKVYRADGTEVTLSTDNSFEFLSGVPARDYTIVITNTTDSNLNINFSITKEQTSGGIVVP
ncbi:MAG: hypothetical protein KIB54_05740 [Clostridium sp.]|nr:hypothetical protein [Clostridium sp.]